MVPRRLRSTLYEPVAEKSSGHPAERRKVSSNGALTTYLRTPTSRHRSRYHERQPLHLTPDGSRPHAKTQNPTGRRIQRPPPVGPPAGSRAGPPPPTCPGADRPRADRPHPSAASHDPPAREPHARRRQRRPQGHPEPRRCPLDHDGEPNPLPHSHRHVRAADAPQRAAATYPSARRHTHARQDAAARMDGRGLGRWDNPQEISSDFRPSFIDTGTHTRTTGQPSDCPVVL